MKPFQSTITGCSLLVAFSLVLVIIGCSNDDSGPVEPPVPPNTTFIQTVYGIFPIGGTESVKGLLAAINVRTGDQNSINSIGLFFGASSQEYIYGGTMFLNNNMMDTISSFGSIIYSRPNSHISAPLDGVLFDGSYHHWKIGGSEAVPAFTDSVASPDGPIIITSPVEDAGVRLDSALLVTWTPSTTDSVLVCITDAGGRVIYSLGTGNQMEFTSGTIGKLAAGIARLDILRYRYHIVKQGTNNIILLAISSDEKDLNLVIPEE